jgi:hypothetical protein
MLRDMFVIAKSTHRSTMEKHPEPKAAASLTLCAMLAAAGCGGSTSPYGEGADTTTSDTSLDAPADWAPGDGTDPAADTIPEPTADVSVDTIPDPVVDTGVDTGWDVPPDTSDDPMPEFVPDPPPMGMVGAACTAPSDCMGVPSPERECVTDFYGYVDLPGGYCSAVCTSDSDCGPLGACVDFYGSASYCMRECSEPYECRVAEGYSCSELPGGLGGPYCIPPFGGPDASPDY